MLLILTSDQDLTTDFLITELIKRKLPYFRVNSEDLASADIKFLIGEEKVRRHLTVGPRSLDLGDVGSVWYRRAVQPAPISALSPSQRVFISGELRHLAMGLVLNPEVIWVNPVDKVSVAEHKIYQLQVARKFGLHVPRTLVSKDLEEIRSFVSDNSHGTICKPIFHGLFVDGNSRYSIYTRRVFSDSFDLDSISVCPVLLQEEVPRAADVRVTIIGTECFVVDIKGEEELVDWRDPEISVSYAPSQIDTVTHLACKNMLNDLGLVYGAFDFVRTPDGDLVFLEVNPTGEWAWLEDRLGLPMRDAFIKLLFE